MLTKSALRHPIYLTHPHSQDLLNSNNKKLAANPFADFIGHFSQK